MIFRIININKWLFCAVFFLGGVIVNVQPLMAGETAGSAFDGHWKGKLFTLDGPCRRMESVRLEVRDGEVSGELPSSNQVYKLSGTIRSDGTTEMILDGDDTTELTGTFESAKAEGRWKSKIGCVGTFKFKRKKK